MEAQAKQVALSGPSKVKEGKRQEYFEGLCQIIKPLRFPARIQRGKFLLSG